jgi:hypothetical protein
MTRSRADNKNMYLQMRYMDYIIVRASAGLITEGSQVSQLLLVTCFYSWYI